MPINCWLFKISLSFQTIVFLSYEHDYRYFDHGLVVGTEYILKPLSSFHKREKGKRSSVSEKSDFIRLVLIDYLQDNFLVPLNGGKRQ